MILPMPARGTAIAVFAVAILAIIAATISVARGVEADPDLHWQTWAGRRIIEQHAIPRQDDLSFTAAGRPWIYHSWLSAVVLGGAYKLAGGAGLAIYRLVVFAAIGAALLRLLLNRCGHLLVSTVGLLIAAPFLGVFINVRGHAFTWLLVAIVILIFDAVRPGRSWPLWLLPPLMAVWVNLHGGFVLGLIVITAAVVETLCGLNCTADPALRRRRGLLTTILLLTWTATLANPWGTQLYAYVWREGWAPHYSISEWQPISRSQVPYYAVCVAAASLAALVTRRARPLDLTVFVLLAAETLRHARFFPALVIASELVFASAIGTTWRQSTTAGPLAILARPWLAAAACLLALVPVAARWLRDPPHLRVTLSPSRFPIDACRFIQSQRIGPNLANDYNWGGYAIWHLHPNQRVAIDGRYLTVYPVDFVERYLRAYTDGTLPQFLAPHPVDAWLVESDGPTAAALRRDSSWREIYRDRLAAVFESSAAARAHGRSDTRMGPDQVPTIPACFP